MLIRKFSQTRIIGSQFKVGTLSFQPDTEEGGKDTIHTPPEDINTLHNIFHLNNKTPPPKNPKDKKKVRKVLEEK